MIDRIQQELPTTYSLQHIKRQVPQNEAVNIKIQNNLQELSWLQEWTQPGYAQDLKEIEKNHWDNLKQFMQMTEEELGAIQQQGYSINHKTERELMALHMNEEEEVIQKVEKEEKEEVDDREHKEKLNKIKEQTDALYDYVLSKIKQSH